MSRLLVAAMWVPLAGCGCDFPPIHGGSILLRENLRRGLEAFFEGVPSESVCVSEVQVKDLPLDWTKGEYADVTHVIAIEDGEITDDDPWYRTAVTHEACHAAQYQLGIPVDDPMWTADDDRYADAQIPHEAFARVCEAGPESIQLIGDSCPDDMPGAEAFTVIRDEVYTRSVIQTLDMTWHEVASATVPGAEDVGFTADGTIDENLRLGLTDGSWAAYVSVRTGAPGALRRLTPPAEPPELQELRIEASASVDDRTLMVVRADAVNGGTARRLVYEDTDGTARLGCLRAQETVFASEGELWSAYAEGDEVIWGYWE